MTMIQSGIKELSTATNSTTSTSGQWNSAHMAHNAVVSSSPTHMTGNILHFICHTNSKQILSVDM